MLRELKKVVEESAKDPQEFQQTANYLVANQFVSAYKHGQRKHFLLVEMYQDYFSKLFDALGMKLYINENERLAGILPVQREAFVRLKTDETLLLLVLRQIYEEKIENFEVDNGFVTTNTHTILERFVQLVKREIPTETRFKEILTLFSRHGVIIRGKTYDEDSKNMMINITPVVRLIVTEAYLRQLESFNGSDPDDDDLDAGSSSEVNVSDDATSTEQNTTPDSGVISEQDATENNVEHQVIEEDENQ
ncbi:DUF4194 domain-containing protein [Marinomonas mediterranea]|jgi:hypothetical protein|uniref:DUF4194 domain-containing protein n=1 Tax=Marinomonas mediterranea (strain ATCC 700492 / JCM 21426 / NBRC 103028 / MMB-1) TaxID=717774 RepID=F2K4K8_MARM1|nr:DUF4194 domain-containing protein [Marinomonas mediterranea]ADZ91401.1 hypothetical protein Marme_2158 [Marinomonas mediterranea MMB-1]WCN09372.1 DUF4194 domain-containing protein [Marinomonas mediterranea]WCN17515.1 DUF4194 domain-containing protein [Marinomonas mediterranea MMB-1]